MIKEPDGDPFAGFEITQEWASGANRHEEAASERAVRYSKINRAHQQVVAEQQETVIQKSSRHPRNWGKVVPWFAFAAICAAFIGLSFVLNGGIGSVHAARTNDGPPVGIGEQDGRIFPPVASNGSKDFIIEQTNPDGTPVTFSPCRPWHIVINTTGAPPGAYQSVVRAAETVSKDTGLQLVVDGDTDEPVSHDRLAYQPDRYGEHWAPILVGWTRNAENEFAGHGGPMRMTDPTTGEATYVSGAVSIDAGGAFNRDPAQLHAIILHEIGHVVGLGHSSNPTQLMAAVNDGQTEYGVGDLAGLAAVGNGKCSPNI